MRLLWLIRWIKSKIMFHLLHGWWWLDSIMGLLDILHMVLIHLPTWTIYKHRGIIFFLMGVIYFCKQILIIYTILCYLILNSSFLFHIILFIAQYFSIKENQVIKTWLQERSQRGGIFSFPGEIRRVQLILWYRKWLMNMVC